MDYDPNYPDRPRHVDFDRLSEVILNLDSRPDVAPRRRSAQIAAGREGEGYDLFFGIVDGKTLSYVAKQRVALGLRLRREGYLPDNDDRAFMQALWIEAFVAGVKFQQEGGHQ